MLNGKSKAGSRTVPVDTGPAPAELWGHGLEVGHRRMNVALHRHVRCPPSKRRLLTLSLFRILPSYQIQWAVLLSLGLDALRPPVER